MVLRSVAAVLAAASWVGLSACGSGSAGGPATAGTTPARPAPTADLVSLQESVVAVAEQVSPSVVSVVVEARVPVPSGLSRFFGPPPSADGDPAAPYMLRRGTASGTIVRSDGYILTNAHVVQQASHIEVRLADDRRLSATVVGTDAATDLAVIRVDARDLPAVTFVDAEVVRPGQWVIAIGAPFGLQHTVTTGVISALGRGDLGVNEIEDYVQTDASINPGNSGGPLVNLDGRVVGINAMIVSAGSGIGFAVPAHLAKVVAEQLIEHGQVRRPWMGLTYQELTPDLAARLEVEAEHGALVGSVVEGGPAHRAGVRPGDVIVGVDGAPVRESHDLLRRILAAKIGQRVRLDIVREGGATQVEVVPIARPEPEPDPAAARAPASAPPQAHPSGLALQTLTPELADELGIPPGPGALVTDVRSGTPAERAGLSAGDLVIEADRAPVQSARDVVRALEDGSALLRVQREGGAFFAVLTAP
jgi:Do/DeqQ family serine protease